MTTDPALSVRPDLTELAPYLSPQIPARYRLNTNEAPYPPPEALVKEIAAELEEITLNRYPDRDASRLFAAISDHIGWPQDGLWVANGSNEVFLHLFLAFGGPGRTSLTFEPTYSLHTLIPRIAGTTTRQQTRGDGFAIDVAAAVDEIQREQPEIVIVCSPNNPTGNVEPRASVEALLAVAPGLVVVDEAYGEFARPDHTCVPLLEDYPNLVVTKTFSKAWRLAGVRIGYMVASPRLVAELARVRLPYHLSAITQVVGEAAIRHAGDTLEMARAIGTERDRIVAELRARNVTTFPSSANFVLFEVPDPRALWQQLLDRGVLVRVYPDVPSLEKCLRVTAGLPEETDAFIAALDEALAA